MLLAASIVLIVYALIELSFAYGDRTALLAATQHARAQSVAAKVRQFIKEIEAQMQWTVQVPWSAAAADQLRLDAMRLLRQVPAINELAYLDATGHQRMQVSRYGPEAFGDVDRSSEPRFVEAKGGKVYYGPLYFRAAEAGRDHGTRDPSVPLDPTIIIALGGTRAVIVAVAEVNLSALSALMKDTKIGTGGRSYLVDAQGRLIAHPDIGLVRGNADFASLPQVRAALTASSDADAVPPLHLAADLQRRDVVTSSAPVAPLDWKVIVEMPAAETDETYRAVLVRTAGLLAAGLALLIVAAFLLGGRAEARMPR